MQPLRWTRFLPVAFLWIQAGLGAQPPMTAAAPASRPVFQVDVANPTKDKPQSKIWFAHGSWWAWLPTHEGSGIWKRAPAGWQRQTSLDGALRGLPGQADVWAGGDTVRAVLVEPRRMAVIGLKWNATSGSYVPAGPPVQFVMPGDAEASEVLETATIARDGRSRWWIAYGWKRSMWVRVSRDSAASQWSEPQALNETPASKDDLCAIVALPGRVGVIWSDQVQDAVYFRMHADGAPSGSWKATEVVARGGRTADDHINTAVAADGTLYVATKNSVDLVGHPQLVLRVRDPQGKWTNHPYAARTAKYEPSRPITLLGGEPPRLLLLHSLYRMDRPKPPRNVVAWQTTELPRLNLAATAQPLIDAGGRVSNVTGPKARLPLGHPWIVLASDEAGNIYEARID